MPTLSVPPIDVVALRSFLAAYGTDEMLADELPVAMSMASAYRLRTSQGARLLHLFDEGEAQQAAMVATLFLCLQGADIPCPNPVADHDGRLFGWLGGRSAILSACPAGRVLASHTAAHCARVGELLARLHRLAGQCVPVQTTGSTVREWRDIAPMLAPELAAADAALLRDEIRFQGLYRFSDLPQGLIHGDIAPEALLFDDGRLCGVLGLERARTDARLRDLAIATTACCSLADGSLDPERVLAMLEAYHAVVVLTPIERGAWPVMLRAAALQQWVRALQHEERADPSVAAAKARLLDRIAREGELQRLWP
ncbi:hypothetical protein BI364_15140 [Acidihalobacter yilgarnensis]|uniref:Homoserine kinase n=1 Tax=Acidihalobacter yilgarnensis TaxID=2819280 RepID=A0A1D8IRR5_9GAMM|nr:homoserine kinase [Acidihalobacter yilgarnensis]AOU99097.1 hypothetical protein BI364_15140 [Acidihalobacter yilgarnensis]